MHEHVPTKPTSRLSRVGAAVGGAGALLAGFAGFSIYQSETRKKRAECKERCEEGDRSCNDDCDEKYPDRTVAGVIGSTLCLLGPCPSPETIEKIIVVVIAGMILFLILPLIFRLFRR